MREIKFRAWDKRQKRMEYHPPHGVGITWRPHISYAHAEGELEVGALHPDIELLQFTGLKDRNNREIFEGDLLDLFPAGGTYMFPENWAKVVWDGAGFCLRKLDDRRTFFALSEEMAPKYEVIGNIHENPDLLESKAKRTT